MSLPKSCIRLLLLAITILFLTQTGFTPLKETNPVDKPNTKGIYRLSRNPMYFGFLLTYIGVGIACASWIFLLVALISLLALHYVLIGPEERLCLEKFGITYQEYMDKTPKWIGVRKLGKK